VTNSIVGTRRPGYDPSREELMLKLVCSGLLAAIVLAAPDAGARSDAPAQLVQKPQPRISPEHLGRSIHGLINRERAAKGLKPLAWDPKLAVIALGHSADMAKRGYFAHASPDGSNFDARYARARYKCFVAVGDVIHGGAENIARDDLWAKITTLSDRKYYDWHSEDELARRTVDGWMKSPGHRANILTPHWMHEGLGVTVTRDLKVYVTQDFC
jgi:uncharacterized protein YkwD